MPTVQATDDFNHAITGAYYQALGGDIWGTPSAVDTPLYQSQLKALKIAANVTTSEGVRIALSGSPTKGWCGMAFRLETLPSGNDIRILTMEDGGGAEARLAIASNGNGYVYISGGSPVNYSGNPFAADQWYWMEWIFDVNDGTGVKKLYWRIGPSGSSTVDQTTATYTHAASTVGTVYPMSASGGGTADWYTGIWKYGSAASASDWLGEPIGGQILLPDADTDAGGWTTAPLYSKLNDASDATYITATAT